MVASPSERLLTTMGWWFGPSYSLVVHSEDPPASEDWDVFITERGEHPTDITAPTLIYSAGGGPNSMQRGQLESLMNEKNAKHLRVAVVTPSRLVRGIGTAVSWFQPNLKVFAPADLEKAYEHLDMAGELRQQCQARLQEMAGQLGVSVAAAG